jgi:hypothetical protein
VSWWDASSLVLSRRNGVVTVNSLDKGLANVLRAPLGPFHYQPVVSNAISADEGACGPRDPKPETRSPRSKALSAFACPQCGAKLNTPTRAMFPKHPQAPCLSSTAGGAHPATRSSMANRSVQSELHAHRRTCCIRIASIHPPPAPARAHAPCCHTHTPTQPQCSAIVAFAACHARACRSAPLPPS